jgi:hypothetical protein
LKSLENERGDRTGVLLIVKSKRWFGRFGGRECEPNSARPIFNYQHN